MYETFYSTISFDTPNEEMISITGKVEQIVLDSGITNGICVVYCPHTTAGIIVNENYDPDVRRDALLSLNKISPNYTFFRHIEGNSDAHIKSMLVGNERTILVKNGALMLGRWQGIFFCEFDGPRSRQVYVSVQGNS